jgi:hypothetical protein
LKVETKVTVPSPLSIGPVATNWLAAKSNTDFPVAADVKTWFRRNWSLKVPSANSWMLSMPLTTLVPAIPQMLSGNVSLKVP